MTRGVPNRAELHDLTPAQAAARWLACEDLDQPPYREAFAQWLAEHQDNREAWARGQRLWGVFETGEDDELIAAMARAARQAGPEPRSVIWLRLIAASLAVAVVTATLLVGVQRGWLGSRATPVQVASEESAPASLSAEGRPDYVTGRGQRSIVDLPDGTRVTLDVDSSVDVAFADGRREVRLLTGRAFFDVAHDRAHPFAVRAGGRTITALGTQFDVQRTPGAVRIVLAEGRVSVAPSLGGAGVPPIELAPGQAFSAKDGAAGVVASVDLGETLAWKQRVVEFRDQPLSEVARLLNRYTRAQIVIRDPEVAALRVNGVFKTGDVKRFGRAVSQVLPVRMIARDADTYELVSTRR
ncbi:MAG: FecR domain-containing protein [Caulobacter sp.]|nr:FecR domain-containing protein [Caulobacter sp.]